MQSLFLFEDKAAIEPDRNNITFARNNFAIIVTDHPPLTHNETDEHIFSVEFASPEEAVCNSTPISEQQLAVSSQSSAHATGSVTIPHTFEGRAGTRRVSYYGVYALFLTPKIIGNDYAIGSVIIGVRGSGVLAINNEETVTINLQPVSEVS